MTTFVGRSYTAGGNQKFGLYANLLGIPVLPFEENSAGEYLETLWRIKNKNLHSARGICTEEPRTRIFDLQGIKNSDKFMLRLKKALATSPENQG